MQQQFKATILNGTVSTIHANSALETIILQTVRRRHRNSQFMRFLLAELLECQFVPTLLPMEEFSPLLNAMVDLDPIKATSVEINAVNFNGPYSKQIVATAHFSLPMKRHLKPKDWTYEMSMSKALQDALMFYWSWWEPISAASGSDGVMDHRLYSDTVAFEMVV